MALVLTRTGALSGGAGTVAAQTELFLKLFSGEVLTHFNHAFSMRDMTVTRTLRGGKSAAFPSLGTASSSYHTAGESVFGDQDGPSTTYLSAIGHKEREIFSDDPVVSGVFVPKIDELRNHYDARQPYVTEIGNALAARADYSVISCIFAAAKADADFGASGSTIRASLASGAAKMIAGTATTGAGLVTFAYEASQKMDEMLVPKADRYILVRPKQYYLLAKEKDLLDRDYSGSNGDYAGAQVMSVAGLKIITSTMMPVTAAALSSPYDLAVVANQPLVRNNPHGGTSGYGVANSSTGLGTGWNECGALVFQKAATGTVKTAEISTESEYFMERRGTLLLASYAMGHGIVRPECAITMKVTAL